MQSLDAIYAQIGRQVVLDYAAPKAKSPKKNCKAGYPCGYGCISKSKACRSGLEGQAKTYADWLSGQSSKVEKPKATKAAPKKTEAKTETVKATPKKTAVKTEATKKQDLAPVNPKSSVNLGDVNSAADVRKKLIEMMRANNVESDDPLMFEPTTIGMKRGLLKGVGKYGEKPPEMNHLTVKISSMQHIARGAIQQGPTAFSRLYNVAKPYEGVAWKEDREDAKIREVAIKTVKEMWERASRSEQDAIRERMQNSRLGETPELADLNKVLTSRSRKLAGANR